MYCTPLTHLLWVNGFNWHGFIQAICIIRHKTTFFTYLNSCNHCFQTKRINSALLQFKSDSPDSTFHWAIFLLSIFLSLFYSWQYVLFKNYSQPKSSEASSVSLVLCNTAANSKRNMYKKKVYVYIFFSSFKRTVRCITRVHLCLWLLLGQLSCPWSVEQVIQCEESQTALFGGS